MGIGPRPRLAGLAMGVAGLVVGGALGAWAGSGTASPTSATVVPTTVPAPAPVDAFPTADPLPAPEPGLFWDGLADGALVALADLPDDDLFVVEGDRLVPVATAAPGRVVALGRSGAALARSDGFSVVAPDGAQQHVATSGPIWARGDLVAWSAAGPRGPEVRVVDLSIGLSGSRTFPLPEPGTIEHADRRGAVVAGSTGVWVVTSDGAWTVPTDEVVVALAGDRLATAVDERLVWRDRATGSEVDGPEPPAGSRDCLPSAGDDDATLWACAGRFAVSSSTVSSAAPAARADLVGGSAIWYQPNDDGPDLVRILDLEAATVATIGASERTIRAVAP